MRTIEFRYDTFFWVNVPLSYPAGQFETQDQWAKAVAGAYALGHPDEVGAHEKLEAVARALPSIPRPGLAERVWYLVNPYSFPLIANVFVVADAVTEGQNLTALSGAYSPTAVRPPIVDSLESATFGTVVRTISVSKTGERERLAMRISLAGRAHGYTVIVEATTPELDYGTLAVDAITDLMDGVTFGDDDALTTPG